jgi:hypothetical protein
MSKDSALCVRALGADFEREGGCSAGNISALIHILRQTFSPRTTSSPSAAGELLRPSTPLHPSRSARAAPQTLTPGKAFLADAPRQKRALDDLYATLQDPDTDHDLRRQLGPQLQHVLAQAQLLIEQRKVRGSANPLCLIATPFNVPAEPQTVKRNQSAAEVSRSRAKAVPATPHEVTKGAAAQAQPFCKNAASVAHQADKLPKTLPARRERQVDQAAKKPNQGKVRSRCGIACYPTSCAQHQH